MRGLGVGPRGVRVAMLGRHQRRRWGGGGCGGTWRRPPGRERVLLLLRRFHPSSAPARPVRQKVREPRPVETPRAGGRQAPADERPARHRPLPPRDSPALAPALASTHRGRAIGLSFALRRRATCSGGPRARRPTDMVHLQTRDASCSGHAISPCSPVGREAWRAWCIRLCMCPRGAWDHHLEPVAQQTDWTLMGSPVGTTAARNKAWPKSLSLPQRPGWDIDRKLGIDSTRSPLTSPPKSSHNPNTVHRKQAMGFFGISRPGPVAREKEKPRKKKNRWEPRRVPLSGERAALKRAAVERFAPRPGSEPPAWSLAPWRPSCWPLACLFVQTSWDPAKQTLLTWLTGLRASMAGLAGCLQAGRIVNRCRAAF